MTDAEAHSSPPGGGSLDPEEVSRHEAHLVGQIYHLIEANKALEEQLHRLSLATEIGEILRGRGLTRDTYEFEAPSLVATARGESAWQRIDEIVEGLAEKGKKGEGLKDCLRILRTESVAVDPDWLVEMKTRVLAAEQTVAFLEEQTREMDALRREKTSIMDGVGKLEQNIEDLWKSLNEKTTHIQHLEKRLKRIWSSFPYRVFNALRRPFRRGQER